MIKAFCLHVAPIFFSVNKFCENTKTNNELFCLSILSDFATLSLAFSTKTVAYIQTYIILSLKKEFGKMAVNCRFLQNVAQTEIYLLGSICSYSCRLIHI